MNSIHIVSKLPKWNSEFDKLANYNSEVVRGLAHTPEWKEKMKELQKEFNEVMKGGD